LEIEEDRDEALVLLDVDVLVSWPATRRAKRCTERRAAKSGDCARRGVLDGSREPARAGTILGGSRWVLPDGMRFTSAPLAKNT
jgi:hypothetical protein